ncbi:phospholipase D family protein [Mesobacterium pallidum]|uniref:phospholipase D family protein n=1 Tax=Mesobacterium pallidum TaxID=2872037 RepID=UPI001EE3316B|nr:phospholipase D-like domain-containing protein [Mesobacterium pallidum]
MTGTRTGRDLRVLVTAAEAYPAFEARALAAREEILLAFRIFDPMTRLRSDGARKLGLRTWADLVEHKLREGVTVRAWLSDFDPVGAPELHEICWHSIRILCGVREAAGPGAGRLDLYACLHPARVGALPRLLFQPVVRLRLRKAKQGLDALPEERRFTSMAERPRLRRILERPRGQVDLHPASHHQKVAVFDREWLYIGGLDLDERRWDTPAHDRPTQETWHDVQVLVQDPALARAGAEHVSSVNEVVGGERPAPQTPGVLRTLSRKHTEGNFWSMSPRPVAQELQDRHLERIARAERLIYLETQFFRDRKIASALARRAAQAPGLSVIMVLPAAPEPMAFLKSPGLDARYGEYLQAHCLRKLRRAFTGRHLIASPAQPRRMNGTDTDVERAEIHDAPLVYLHSKVSIFDETAAIVSSANLNGRSMRWDTEAGIELTDPTEIAALRARVMGAWLPAEERGDPAVLLLTRALPRWKRLVMENRDLAPEQRRGLLVPYDLKAVQEAGTPVPGMPEEMV